MPMHLDETMPDEPPDGDEGNLSAVLEQLPSHGDDVDNTSLDMSPHVQGEGIIEESLQFETFLASLSTGLDTVAFASAEAFLQARPWVPAACLILDVQLPGMTGWELVAYLRAIDTKIPVIIMTAYNDRQTRDHAMDADVVAYLRKPFHDQELIAALQQVISQRRAEPG